MGDVNERLADLPGLLRWPSFSECRQLLQGLGSYLVRVAGHLEGRRESICFRAESFFADL
jgi:hypothetical protein